MFTKQHYKAIAEIITRRIALNQGTGRTPHFLYADDLALDLADYFAKDNPQFDKDKFFVACGLDSK